MGYKPIVYSKKFNINFVNDLSNPITVRCLRGDWTARTGVPPHGGVAQFSFDCKDRDKPPILAQMYTVDSYYDLSVDIDIQKGCKDCAERGCFWSVRQDGLYQLINGKWVKVGYWDPDR
ncbi:Hypothetical predicted protein [Olea europaea subsp. europaea]|uniref:S-protein homolog n=1 Tax=Olea europaea subsp. europaea TaxID=158383 RepID=A0A8S0UI38_OLEEU|nr:Hypothetical predicted protein [Olea europaea subsp. europaea]